MSEVSRGRVLNVNDEELTRVALSRILHKAGFEVVEAATGAEALERAKALPRLVLLDVNLPDMSGFEVCRKFKSQPETADIPIVLISAHHTDSEDKMHGLLGGADAYVIHPVEARELVALLDALLRSRVAESEVRTAARQWQVTFDAISDGICVLDSQGKVVRCNQALASLLGKRNEEVLDQPYREILPRPLAGLAEVCTRLDALQQREVHEQQWQDRWLRITTDPIREDRGRLVGAVQVLVDLTDQKRAEAAEREANLVAAQMQQMEAEMTGLQNLIQRFGGP